jgi:hypothetical protein
MDHVFLAWERLRRLWRRGGSLGVVSLLGFSLGFVGLLLVPFLFSEFEVLGPFWSAVVAFFCFGLGPLWIAWDAARWARMLSRQRKAHEKAVSQGPLTRGPVLLRGRVEPERPGAPVVSCVIRQEGEQRYVSPDEGEPFFTHSWFEVSRRSEANPFYLRLSDGSAVRVEPGSAPVLLDTLEASVEGSARSLKGEPHGFSRGAWREKSTRLREGEEVCAEGTLAEGFDPRAPGLYRDTGRGLVLRPASPAPMLLSSQETIPAVSGLRRRFYGVFFLSLLLVLVAQSLLLSFSLRWLRGERVRLELVEVKETGEYLDGDELSRLVWRAENETEARFSFETTAPYKYQGRSDFAAFVDRKNPQNYNLGAHAGVSIWWSWVGFALWGFLWGGYASFLSRRLPWYWRKRLNEFGTGSLADTCGSPSTREEPAKTRASAKKAELRPLSRNEKPYFFTPRRPENAQRESKKRRKEQRLQESVASPAEKRNVTSQPVSRAMQQSTEQHNQKQVELARRAQRARDNTKPRG